jgi:hypothetical protein
MKILNIVDRGSKHAHYENKSNASRSQLHRSKQGLSVTILSFLTEGSAENQVVSVLWNQWLQHEKK